VLADHVWLWSDGGRPVAVPVAGREVHGVLVDAPADAPPGLTAVSVRTVAGDDVVALADVVPGAEPAPPDLALLAAILAAARRHGLPDAWLDQLDAWRRAAEGAARPGLDEDGPATLGELLAVPGVVERSVVRSNVGFLAIHGGDLEAMTDVVAEQAAEAAGASCYCVIHPLGYRGHLSSAAFDPAESVRLAQFVDHVDVAISIHGYGRAGRWVDVLVGGRNRTLAAHLAAVVAPRLEGYSLVTELDAIPAELRGLHERNPVNRPRRGGVQIELPPRVRGLSPLSPPPGADGLSPPTRALIDALADAAVRIPPEC
jgi:phage replication-related protein YjqB (UPF0714/DUF867 family)